MPSSMLILTSVVDPPGEGALDPALELARDAALDPALELVCEGGAGFSTPAATAKFTSKTATSGRSFFRPSGIV